MAKLFTVIGLLCLSIFSLNIAYADNCPTQADPSWSSLNNPIVSANTFEFAVYLTNVAMYCYYQSPTSPIKIGALIKQGSFTLNSGPWQKSHGINGLKCEAAITSCNFTEQNPS